MSFFLLFFFCIGKYLNVSRIPYSSICQIISMGIPSEDASGHKNIENVEMCGLCMVVLSIVISFSVSVSRCRSLSRAHARDPETATILGSLFISEEQKRVG